MKPIKYVLLICTFIMCGGKHVQAQELLGMRQIFDTDSLERYVRVLSGEDSVWVNGTKVLIQTRENPNNDLAADFIEQQLTKYGLNVTNHNYSSTGRNVLGRKTGTKYQDSVYIISAHYDSFAPYAADDNGSGTAALLEIARIFKHYCFQYPIIFAFWDEEENYVVGSSAYVNQLPSSTDTVLGVINVDAIAYDSDFNGRLNVQTMAQSVSQPLIDTVDFLVNDQGLSLDPFLVPSTGLVSDHKPFNDMGYAAISLGQDFYLGDSNPNSHSISDRIIEFNMGYFHEMSQLALTTIAQLASPDSSCQVDVVIDTCAGSFEWRGDTIYQSGVYYDTTWTGGVQDTIYTLFITYDSIDATIAIQGDSIVAIPGYDSYEWINCQTGNVILNESDHYFSPSTSGLYAAVIGEDQCKDTSTCEFVNVPISSVNEGVVEHSVMFPNPASDKVSLSYMEPYGSLVIYDARGRVVLRESYIGTSALIDISILEGGYYFVETTGCSELQKLIVIR